MRRLARSVQLARASASVLGSNRFLVLLPASSAVLSLAVVAAAAVPALGDGTSPGQSLLLWAIVVVVVGYVQAFFYAALTSGAVDHFAGRRPTLSTAVDEASVLLPLLLGWAVLCWLFAAVIAVFRDRIPLIGPIVAGLGEKIWGVVTYLSMPVMVVERQGPVRSVKRSARLVKRTWGENLFAQVGLSIVTLVLLVPVGAAAAVAATVHTTVAVLVGAAGTTIVLSFVGALDAVYRVALYRYAVGARQPDEFTGVCFDDLFATRQHGWY